MYSHASLHEGICSEMVVRCFCRCVKIMEYTYTNLDGIAYRRPTLYGTDLMGPPLYTWPVID